MRRKLFVLATLALVGGVTAAPIVPRQAPNLTWRLASKQAVDLKQYQGKAVALSFVLTTCPHCQNCSRILQKLYKEYGPRGFEPIGIAINEMSHILVEDYMRDFGLSYPVGYLDREAACEFLQHPLELRMMMPYIVFIDRKGVIRAQFSGDDKFFLDEEKNIRREIEKLLSDSPAPRLAGNRGSAAGSQGISVYSLDSRRYEHFTEVGWFPRWLSDSRRLVFFRRSDFDPWESRRHAPAGHAIEESPRDLVCHAE